MHADEVETVTWATAKLGEARRRRLRSRDAGGASTRRQMAAFHEGWDVLLTPGLATLPVKLGWPT